MDEEEAPDEEPEPKELVFLQSEIKTPPFTFAGRREAGRLLRGLQHGALYPMPTSRPMPSIGSHCHELRVRDEAHNWRIFYRIDPTVIVIAAVLPKETQKTPKTVIALCKTRLARYDRSKKGKTP